MWLSLAVLASVALYLWVGDGNSTDAPSKPPVAPSNTGRPVIKPGPAPQAMPAQPQPRPWELGAAYRQPGPAPYTGSMYGAYPITDAYDRESAPTQDYRFRPLTQSEKAKLEQQAVSTPSLAAPAEPRYRGEPSSGYPIVGYAAGGHPSPREMQAPPTPTYKFRELDSDKASKRWTGNYEPPARAIPPTAPNQGSPYAPSWSPTLPYQRRSLANEGPLWAAEGMHP